MNCEISTLPEDTICEFRVTYALNSFMAGSVKFLDCECELGPECEQLCEPICIGIDSTLKTDCFEEEQFEELSECYENPPKWLNGLLTSHGFSYQDSISTFSVEPFSEYLHNKPLNSQNFCGSTLGEVIPLVLQYYAGLSPSVFCIQDEDFNFTFDNDCRIKGPVEGNSTLVELAKLAQAGCANLFTQVGGKLTIDKWKDHTSPVEFVIPPEYTIRSEKAQFNPVKTTAILMRGAPVSQQDCGNNSLTRNEDGPGPVKKCIFSGVKSPSVSVGFNNLSGTQEDIQNAEVIAQGDNNQTVSDLTSDSDGNANAQITLPGGGQIGCTPECVNIQINGQNQNNDQDVENGIFYGYGNNQNGGYGWGTNDRNFFDNYNRLINGLFPIPYYMFGLGDFVSSLGPGVNTNTNGNFSDQPSMGQCELFVTSSEDETCGVSFEDHENRYVYNKEQLNKIGIRRLQELQLANNTWNVELPYLPCLKINQVVEFTTQELEGGPEEGCGPRTIKGIIGALSIEHSKSGSGLPTKMRAAIMDVSCLEGRVYQSGNLVNSLCAHSGASELSPWQASRYDLDQGSGVNECLFMYAFGNPSNAFLEYTHEKTTPGCIYTINFDWEFIQGSGPVFFEYDSGAASGGQSFAGLANDSGSFTGSFTAGTGSNDLVLNFQMQNPNTPTYFKVYNLEIRSICTT